MKDVTDYYLVSQPNPAELSSYVANLIEDGWQPYGSPFVFVSNENENVFCQALVKYPEL